jgi:hypothetical protein
LAESLKKTDAMVVLPFPIHLWIFPPHVQHHCLPGFTVSHLTDDYLRGKSSQLNLHGSASVLPSWRNSYGSYNQTDSRLLQIRHDVFLPYYPTSTLLSSPFVVTLT